MRHTNTHTHTQNREIHAFLHTCWPGHRRRFSTIRLALLSLQLKMHSSFIGIGRMHHPLQEKKVGYSHSRFTVQRLRWGQVNLIVLKHLVEGRVPENPCRKLQDMFLQVLPVARKHRVIVTRSPTSRGFLQNVTFLSSLGIKRSTSSSKTLSVIRVKFLQSSGSNSPKDFIVAMCRSINQVVSDPHLLLASLSFLLFIAVIQNCQLTHSHSRVQMID